MVSPVQAALNATHAATRRVRGENVTYRRSAITVTVEATRGSTRWDAEQPTTEGVTVEERSVDWLIDAAELTAAGITGPPQRGDTVSDAAGNTYRIFPFGSGEQLWRWHDRSETVYRIYTKERTT